MTDKGSLKQGITLKLDGLFIHDSEEVSELLNSYYNTITESLNLSDWGKKVTPGKRHSILNVIAKFKNP